MEAFDIAKLDALLAELDRRADAEHPDIAVSADDGWTPSTFPNGLLVWENIEVDDAPPRHAVAVSRSEVRRLLAALGQADLSAVETFTWAYGYGA